MTLRDTLNKVVLIAATVTALYGGFQVGKKLVGFNELPPKKQQVVTSSLGDVLILMSEAKSEVGRLRFEIGSAGEKEAEQNFKELSESLSKLGDARVLLKAVYDQELLKGFEVGEDLQIVRRMLSELNKEIDRLMEIVLKRLPSSHPLNMGQM